MLSEKSKENRNKQFIDEQMEIKKNSKGAQRFIAKRQLNSVYGKFATNPNVTPKIPFIDKDDGVLRLHDPMFTTYEDGEVKEVIDEQFRDPIYLPYGEFVTVYARKYTISTAQKVGIYRVAYIDTDSIHLVGTQVPDAIKDIIDDKELGYWGLESVFTRSYFKGWSIVNHETSDFVHTYILGMPLVWHDEKEDDKGCDDNVE